MSNDFLTDSLSSWQFIFKITDSGTHWIPSIQISGFIFDNITLLNYRKIYNRSVQFTEFCWKASIKAQINMKGRKTDDVNSPKYCQKCKVSYNITTISTAIQNKFVLIGNK